MDSITKQVNLILSRKEPWQIAAISCISTLATVWTYNFLNKDEDIFSRSKKCFFKLARYIPYVRNKIEKELSEIQQRFEEDMERLGEKTGYILSLPENGMNNNQIMDKIDSYLQLGHFKWEDGFVSGAVYNFEDDLVDLMTDVFKKTAYTNPLHADIFPGICKMEAEVLRMACKLFNGDSNSCGSVSSGGTESIMLACKAYRNYAREMKGATRYNMVLSVTAHTAFDKAADYLGIHVRRVKVDENTMKVDLKAMRKAVDKNTIMLVGSAPSYPYGTLDDIEGIAKIATDFEIPFHVDACLGGFLIVFMKRAGYLLPKFDFSVKGVTSISADTHKYGYTPKGSSLILYSDKKYLHHQYSVITNWPGGIYGSPSVAGSRAGSSIASTWACMLHYGLEGYVENTKAIIDTSRYIESELRKIKGIFIFGTPATSVIAIGSKVFDIFRLSDGLLKKSWNLNTLQFPSGIHICVTFLHTKPSVADNFIRDTEEIVAELMKSPEKPVEGKMALYGMAQSIPDRTVVGDFTKLYLDSLCFTPKKAL